MSDHASQLAQLGWQDGLLLAACSNCGLGIMQPADMFDQPCVHCGSYLIEELDPDADQPPHLAPPELILNTKVDEKKAHKELSNWYSRFFFPPADLSLPTLMSRIRLMYVPVWLMDTRLNTQWAADVGFDYEVISSQEKLRGSTWSTTEVKRIQQDWEGRAGTINLNYENIPADAIEREFNFWPVVRLTPSQHKLLHRAEPYNATTAEKATFLLPSRIPADAVNDMLPSLMGLAQDDVQSACRADHIRNFNWAPKIEQQNWTKLLMPVWSTWYKDEDDRKRMLFINATTGQGWGERIPSMRRTWQVGLYMLIVAAVFMVAGLTFGLLSNNWAVMGLMTLIVFVMMGSFLLMAVYTIFQKNKEDFFGRF